MDTSPGGKGLKSKLLWSWSQENLMFRANLDNLVKPCLKIKVVLKKLRKAGTRAGSGAVWRANGEQGVEKENCTSVLLRVDPEVHREQNQMFLFSWSWFSKVQNRCTIVKGRDATVSLSLKMSTHL